MVGFLEGVWSGMWGFKEILRSNELRMTGKSLAMTEGGLE